MDRNRKIEIMGIVNITDNSYYSASRCLSEDGKADVRAAMDRIGTMVHEGADIIDIGACSTRPGSQGVGAEVEWQRLEPVLAAVRSGFPDIRISIDTYWAEVVRRCFDRIGDFIVNDISAGEDDPQMLPTVGELGLEYVAMHKRGNPMTMQSLTDYPLPGTDDPDYGTMSPVTAAVRRYFLDFADKAEDFGIREWVLDPGFGFAKTVEQNWQLMDEMESILIPGRRTLVGVSRKSMIYRLFDITPEESLPATQALHLAALQRGADILRVHDVAEAKRTVEIFRRLG
ncbi:MAG: dihydropteroate synthase [Bacteroidales bacterium]|nr:dihydropteroate synthase [Bacteroidales bacterium]